ncbi:MAG: hypothetical protein ACF8GE_10370, partial [Phycisphaerales bacterium JB043]
MAKAGSQYNQLIVMSLLGIVCVALIVVSIIMYGGRTAAEAEVERLQSNISDVYPPGVQNSPQVAYYMGAKQGPLVGYLANSLSNVMLRVTGSDQTTPQQLAAMLDGAQDPNTGEIVASEHAVD